MNGIRLDHGCVQVRIHHQGRTYYKNFGPNCPDARKLAEIHIAEKKREILMGKFGITPELPEKTFKELVPVYMDMWTKERDGDGKPKHGPVSIYERRRVFDRVLVPYFGTYRYHNVRTVDVEKWRDSLLTTGVLGTTINRYMVPLGDMFSAIATAVATERIPAFKQPAENPCKHATKAKMRKREVIYTDYELKKLHMAFNTLGDQDGWEICVLALKSVLSLSDLKKLEIGQTIDLDRSKTGVPVHIPITVLEKLNWKNWRRRWSKAREVAGLKDKQFRDLRKTGGNKPIGKFDLKLVSQYFGHSNIKTTENSYMVTSQEKMRPIAEFLEAWTRTL